jgi:hypothetical protein
MSLRRPGATAATAALMIVGLTQTGYLQSAAHSVLEDFSTLRNNAEGLLLWSPYDAGVNPGQVGGLENGTYRLNVPVGSRPYVQFFPYPYNEPVGFAHDWLRSGTWSAGTNRLSFWIKTDATIARSPDGAQIAEIGTYSKDPKIATADNQQGAHYYHLIDSNFVPNRWVRVVLNRTPQHQVGEDPTINWPENPTASSGYQYYDGLTRFYFTDEYGDPAVWGNHSYWLRDFQFDTVSGEPDSQVSTILAFYDGQKYQVTWAGLKNTSVTYSIRYKSTSMKSAGFSSGTDGGTTQNPGTSYTGCYWQSPPMSEAALIYIAIQPQGSTSFTEIALPSQSGTAVAPPAAPTNVRILASLFGGWLFGRS